MLKNIGTHTATYEKIKHIISLVLFYGYYFMGLLGGRNSSTTCTYFYDLNGNPWMTIREVLVKGNPLT